MALNDVTFIRGQAGLGRPLPNQDHVSGLLNWITDANLPAGFLTTDRVKEVFSIEEAEALGITEGSATTGVIWYHINEYFLMQPKGDLFIGLFGGVAATVDYSDIEDVQNFAEGKIRQIGVLDVKTTYASANTTTLQASVANLQAIHMPLNVIYAADISGTADLSTLADLRALSNENVSVVIAEDGAGVGAALAVSETNSITALGAVLGAVSLAAVNENIGWTAKFNVVKGTEFDVPAMANGDLNKTLSSGLLDGLQTKGYIFFRKYVDFAGTYFNDSPTAIAVTNDLAYIENNRTIDKAVRGIRTFLLPNLNGPLLVNDDGTLAEETVANLQNDARQHLEAMERDAEVSAFVVLIDPSQDVLATSKVVVTVQIVPVGVARQIEVNIGFTVSIS